MRRQMLRSLFPFVLFAATAEAIAADTDSHRRANTRVDPLHNSRDAYADGCGCYFHSTERRLPPYSYVFIAPASNPPFGWVSVDGRLFKVY